MVKRLVKKASTVKTVKKIKVSKTAKAVKTTKKAVSKPASKTIKKKSVVTKPVKATIAKAKPANVISKKISAKKPTFSSKIKKTVEKKTPKKIEKSKTVETPTQNPNPKISGEKYMSSAQQGHFEEYMNPKHQAHFRQVLLSWKKQLLGEMERTVHHMQDEAANFPDPNDRATQEEEFSLELRARDRERKLIKKIDEALMRLDNHDYGYCEACGVEIGVQRLNARPTATLCIDCKTIDEIREKHFS